MIVNVKEINYVSLTVRPYVSSSLYSIGKAVSSYFFLVKIIILCILWGAFCEWKAGYY